MKKIPEPSDNTDRTVWCRLVCEVIDHSYELRDVDANVILATCGLTRQDIFIADSIERPRMIEFLYTSLKVCGPILIPLCAAEASPGLLGPVGLLLQTAPNLERAMKDLVKYKPLYAPNALMGCRVGDRQIELTAMFPQLGNEGIATLWCTVTAACVWKTFLAFPNSRAVKIGFTTSGGRHLDPQSNRLLDECFAVDLYSDEIRSSTNLRPTSLSSNPTTYRWDQDIDGPGMGWKMVVPLQTARRQNYVHPPESYDLAWNTFKVIVQHAKEISPTLDTVSSRVKTLMISLGKPLQKAEVGDRLAMTERTLERHIRKELNLTFKELRAQAVFEMVNVRKSGGMSDKEISDDLGFKTLAQMQTCLQSLPSLGKFLT